jgi:hypothetical protein
LLGKDPDVLIVRCIHAAVDNLLHHNGIYRAGWHTGTAEGAFIQVYHGNMLLHRNGIVDASALAGCAADALSGYYFNQPLSPDLESLLRFPVKTIPAF